eukprot:1365966-Amorphochlora_amoeboformis.AAC.1
MERRGHGVTDGLGYGLGCMSRKLDVETSRPELREGEILFEILKSQDLETLETLEISKLSKISKSQTLEIPQKS